MAEETNQQSGAQPSSGTFDDFIAAQPDDVKTLYTTHTAGLKSALDSERGARKDLEKQLRDLAKQAEAGSTAQKQLTEQADRLQALEKQTSFFDRAHSAGVRNLKLAYLAAQQAGLIDDKGEADFTKLRTVYPELFFQAPTANAGNGTSETRTANNINDAIRRAAGRQ